MDVASICGGGKEENNPFNLWILIVLEVLLLVLIITKVRNFLVLYYLLWRIKKAYGIYNKTLIRKLHLLQLIYDYWQYNAYGRMPWLARQICMGEMCKANQSFGQGRLQNNKYDIESPSYDNFYKLSTWKRLLCKPKTSTSSHSGNRCSIVDKEEKNYMVIYFKFYLTPLALSLQMN